MAAEPALVRRLLALAFVITRSLTAPAAAQSSTGEPGNICTDRPTKANFACTVDVGHFQYETDLVNDTVEKTADGTTQLWLITNPTIKYGVSSWMDLEVNLVPLELLHGPSPGQHSSSIGDLYLRGKIAYIHTSDDLWQASAIPFIKFPTARDPPGDGVVESGIILPVNYKVADIAIVTIDPELDLLRNARSDGRHPVMNQLLNVAFNLPAGMVLYTEWWESWNFDPAQHFQERSADVALTFAVTKHLQLDFGINKGLDRETPRLQGYVGISQEL